MSGFFYKFGIPRIRYFGFGDGKILDQRAFQRAFGIAAAGRYFAASTFTVPSTVVSAGGFGSDVSTGETAADSVFIVSTDGISSAAVFSERLRVCEPKKYQLP